MTRLAGAVERAVVAALPVDPRPSRWTALGGSALNRAWRLDHGDARYFVKLNAAARLPMLEAEFDGLEALAGPVRVPRPIAHGAHGDTAFLVLEWLDLAGEGRDAALGAALAGLHRSTGKRFGWHRDNTIGTTPQINTWSDDWARFFRDRRIAPQLERALAAGHRSVAGPGHRLLDAIPRLLAGHEPVASLLHGDLWSGNAGRLRSGEPVVFDPAVYFGDRETDLAMTELFGGFAPAFYDAYREAWPLAAGYERRRDLYNLYHVLNHLNLFGVGYLRQAQALLDRLLGHLA